MKDSILQETRKAFNLIKHEVKKGNENIMPYFSGSLNKRTRMYTEAAKYREYAKLDYELGVISEEEYKAEMKAVFLLEKAISNFTLF